MRAAHVADFGQDRQSTTLKASLDKASNISAEATVLGAMMLDNGVVPAIVELLEPQDFYEPAHAAIYCRIVALVDAGKVASSVTIRPYFDDDAALADVGGADSYLATLTAHRGATVLAADYARQVADFAKRRALLLHIDQLVAATNDFSLSNDAIVEGLDTGLSTILERRPTTSSHTLYDAYGAALAEIEDEAAGRIPRGVTINGLPDFTDIAGDMRGGEVIVLGARPATGKTAVALKISVGAAANGHGVLYISLEMRVSALTKRMIADLAFTDLRSPSYERIKRGQLNPVEWDRIRAAQQHIREWPLEITDPASLKVSSLGMMIRRYKRRMVARGARLELVVVDYLGLLKASQRGSAYETTTEISKTLREVAKECDVAMLALVQLNREVEKREDKHPQTSDLRDSGQIEQDADCIAFLYREQLYLEQAEPDINDPKRGAWEEKLAQARDKLEIYTVKRRDGKIGKRHCHFFGEHQAVRGSGYYRDLHHQDRFG